MSKATDLVKNTIIIAAGKLSTQFLTFLLLPLYTAYLAKDEFGSVDLTLTYIILLSPIILLSLEMASFRFLIDARSDETKKAQVITNVIRTTALSAAFVGAAFLIINYFIEIPYGWLTLGGVLATIVVNMFLQFARGLGSNLKYSIGGVVAGVTTVAANILLIVALGMGGEGILLALILGNGLAAAYLFYSLKLYRYINFSYVDASLSKDLLKYSIPLIPNGVAWWMVHAADRTIIAIVLGVASNGIYAVAYRFSLIFNGLFSFFGMSWTESASVHIDSKDRDKYFSRVMDASVRLFGSAGAVVIIVIPMVFGLLIDDAYHDAYKYIPLLIIASLLNAIAQMYGGIYIAKKKTREIFISTVIAAIASIVLMIALIQHLELFAPAVGAIVASLVMIIYRYFDTRKYVKIAYAANLVLSFFVLYVIVVTAYYLASTWVQLLVALFTIGIAYWLNKQTIRGIMRVTIGRFHGK